MWTRIQDENVGAQWHFQYLVLQFAHLLLPGYFISSFPSDFNHVSALLFIPESRTLSPKPEHWRLSLIWEMFQAYQSPELEFQAQPVSLEAH